MSEPLDEEKEEAEKVAKMLEQERDEISLKADNAMLDIFGSNSENQMQNLLGNEKEQTNEFDFGEKLTGTIVAVTSNSVLLDINAKSEGIIDLKELEKNGELKLKVGDTLTAYFDGMENGEICLSSKMRSDNVDTSALQHAYENAIPIDGKVVDTMKAGLSIKLGGARAFCPSS